ncbi:MAG: hypothetical protein D6732_12995 [Methanobacteriota archaeon]|nr:MAG: hypothetical protein D6732_12995 [Euryarchaeota archaeon]
MLYFFLIGIISLPLSAGDCPDNTSNEAEIFFLDGASWHADIANGFAINSGNHRDDSLNHGIAKPIQNAGGFQGATGFGFYDGVQNGELDELGKGLYKFSSGGQYFYYDLRNCPDPTGNVDLIISDLPFSFYFYTWGCDNTCSISDGDTIRVSWVNLPPEIYETHDIVLFGNPTNYECFESSITMKMQYQTELINGIFEIPTKNMTVTSGDSIKLLRADTDEIIGESSAFNNANDIVFHNHWIVEGSPKTRQIDYLTDQPGDLINDYKLHTSLYVSSSSQAIPISI